MLKKMSVTKVTPTLFIFSFISTFLLIILTASIFEFSLTKLIWQGKSPNPNFAIIIPWLMTVVVSILIGLLIGNVAKSSSTAFAIGVAIFMPTIFLAGILFSEMGGWINKFSKILPQNHTILLFKVAWYTDSISVHNYNGVVVKLFDGDWKDTLLVYLYPMGISSILIFSIAKKFKWE